MKDKIFIFALLMIFSTTLTRAENIKMSCRPLADLFKYEDNLFF